MATEKRLIWGDIAEEHLTKLAEYYKGSFSGDAFERAAQEIAIMPTVDAVEVIRCKECKHYRNHPNGLCYLHTEPYENKQGCKGDAVCVEPDDFCSYGERKDNG